MTARETPCQKCKADNAALKKRVSELAKHHELMVDAVRRNYTEQLAAADREWFGKLEAADAGLVAAVNQKDVLRRALVEAIARLNDYLAASEGAPDPSENDTKRLVARLHEALQTTP